MSKEKLTTLDNLTYFLSWLNRKFSALDHTHTAEEIGITVDSALSSTSTNPVQNKVVNNALVTIAEDMDKIDADINKINDEKADKTELPTKVSQLENDSNYATNEDVTTALNNKLTHHTDVEDVHMTDERKTQLTDAYTHSKDTNVHVTSEEKAQLLSHKDDVGNPHQILEKIEANSDLVVTELGDEIVGDSPELDPVVESRISEIETEVSSLKSDLNEETAERKAEIAVERERINQFTRLEEGGTTGDAELMDIRVGADGKTYDSAGAAVREQVSQLSSDIVGLKNTNNILDYRSIDNIALKTTGVEERANNWKSTDFINVTGRAEYFANGTWIKPSNEAYASVIYFDSEMNVIEYINETESQTYDMKKFSFPINTAYVRFCFGSESTIQIFMNIPSMNEYLKLKTVEPIFNHKITTGGTIAVAEDLYVTSELIPINRGAKFITVKKGTFIEDRNLCYISFWSRPSTVSGFFVKGYQNHLLSVDFTNIKIPNEAKYFCFSWLKKDKSPMYKQDSDILENKTPSDVIGKYITLNTLKIPYTICLIGDSITQGVGSTGFQQYDAVIDGQHYNVRGNGPNNPNATSNYKIGQYLWTSGGRRWYEAIDGRGWAQLFKNYMAEKFSVDVRNFGMSGINSGDLDAFVNNFLSVSYHFDCIVLMIGTNNRGKENLESFYNDMNNTIKTIKNYGKDLIILANIPASIENEKNYPFHMEDIHNVLRNISCENKIPFISVYDLFMDYCSNKDIEIDTLLTDGLHPNDEGYRVMFQLITKAMGIAVKRPNATW